MADSSFELAPRPGQTTSQRKAELDSARFVAVRNLAYMIYKKPNSNEPLMTYQETLEDRDAVKMAIINHELAIGSLVNDGLGQTAPMQQPAAAGPQMMAPSYATPQQMTMTPATPAQAAQAAAPQAQPAPAAAQSTGRPRRGARSTQEATPSNGTQATVQMPSVTPVAAQAAAPGFMAPAGAVMETQRAIVAPQTVQAAVGPSQDFSEVIARLDRIGQGLSQVSKDIDSLAQRVVLLEAVLGKVNLTTLQSFAALHHIYTVQSALGQALQAERVGTLDQFRSYLTPKYTGNP